MKTIFKNKYITPTKNFARGCDSQNVASSSYWTWNLNDSETSEARNKTEAREIIGISMTKATIGTFSTGINISIELDNKGGIFATNNLLSFCKDLSGSL